ncbi:MAG TPA: hypothetical protein VKP30_17690, partial [Polyangiaceae bacterium]|nr:hypothetical protein [Polyangiaceae bacterium]
MRHRLYALLYLTLGFVRGRRGRATLIALLLTLATAFYLWFSDVFYPIKHWLFFRYLGAWACVALFMSSVLVGGWGLLAKLLPRPPRLPERLILSLATGVLAFYCLMFLLGIGKLYSRNLSLAVPLVLLGAGGPRAFVDWQRILRRSGGGGVLRIRNWIGLLSALLVTVSLLAIYLQVMLPKNLHADSHWYHLPVAEYYIAAGGIVRFPEGWYLGTYPQLATLLYSWAFLTPGDLFSHVSLCLHLDFALFLVTVAGVAVVAARLLRVRR